MRMKGKGFSSTFLAFTARRFFLAPRSSQGTAGA